MLDFICHYGNSGSYLLFLFEDHPELTREIIKGDQIWTDGAVIEIYEGCDQKLLDGLISIVNNKDEFKQALREEGFYAY